MSEEKKLYEIAKRLGSRDEENLDVDRVADAVLERLSAADNDARVPDPSVHRHGRRTLLGAIVATAAIILLLIAGNLMSNRSLDPGSTESAALAPLALDELSDEELSLVLDSLTLDAPVSETYANGLSALNETELEELLAMMED